MVHCTAAGSAPPDVESDILKVTFPPGIALPKPEETVTCCAIAGLAAAVAKTHKILRILLVDLANVTDNLQQIIKSSTGGHFMKTAVFLTGCETADEFWNGRFREFR